MPRVAQLTRIQTRSVLLTPDRDVRQTIKGNENKYCLVSLWASCAGPSPNPEESFLPAPTVPYHPPTPLRAFTASKHLKARQSLGKRKTPAFYQKFKGPGTSIPGVTWAQTVSLRWPRTDQVPLVLCARGTRGTSGVSEEAASVSTLGPVCTVMSRVGSQELWFMQWHRSYATSELKNESRVQHKDTKRHLHQQRHLMPRLRTVVSTVMTGGSREHTGRTTVSL